MNQQLAAGIEDAAENAEEATPAATQDTGICMLLQIKLSHLYILYIIFFFLMKFISLQSYALMSFVSVFSYSGFWDTGNQMNN